MLYGHLLVDLIGLLDLSAKNCAFRHDLELFFLFLNYFQFPFLFILEFL